MSSERQRQLLECVRWAREHSPFYRELYRDLPKSFTLNDLPPLNSEEFWAANGLVDNRVLSGDMTDGLILRSGGTSGQPKFSVFAREEWSQFVRDFAHAFAQTGVREGDRVANLFYSGQLYGSFLFTHRVIEECPTRLLSLPIGGGSTPAESFKLIDEFSATVIAALPTTIMSLASYLEENPGLAARLRVRLVLFAGESLYPDQRARITQLLPGVIIGSIGYASNDAGFLGAVDASCGINEFRIHPSMIYEILDEDTGEPILESGVVGRAVITDLRRRLMPIIRYPVGDRAQWLEPEGRPDRKLQLVGRSDEAARIASLSLYYQDFENILRRCLSGIPGCDATAVSFQLIVMHRDSRDGLIVRIGGPRALIAQAATLNPQLLAVLFAEQPMIQNFEAAEKIWPTRIDWVAVDALETNARSGKLRRVIDLRA